MARLSFLFIGIVFALVGIGILYLGITLYAQSSATSSWPSVTGTILSSNVTSTYSCNNNANGGQSCSYSYTPLVSYKYSVDGTSYLGHDIVLNYISSSDSAGAYADAGEYPVGANVSVYYNPQLPSEAVLQTGAGLSDLLLPTIGAVFLIIGVIVLILGIVSQGVGFSPPPA